MAKEEVPRAPSVAPTEIMPLLQKLYGSAEATLTCLNTEVHDIRDRLES